MSTANTVGTGKRHRRSGHRIIALCIACLATACKAPTPMPPLTSTPALASLSVEVRPAGAIVYVNEEEKGRTPLTLRLPAGSYTVRVQQPGYDFWQRDVELLPGEQMLMAQALRDSAPPIITLSELPDSVEAGEPIRIAARATDNQTVAFMRLWVDGKLVTEPEGPVLEHLWDTTDSSTSTHTIAIEAGDDAGNISQATATFRIRVKATLYPSATPAPSTTPSPQYHAYETAITLPTYPYETYLKERPDSRYNSKVLWLDRAAYEASSPQPQPRTFKAVVLENQYLRLTFLPELGGRLYECIHKPSGRNIFYQNSVLKPSYWGPLSRDENWWLAAGGMEWALPVAEHGYEWGLPWTYTLELQGDGVSIVLRDSTADDRLRAEIRVTLPGERGYFVVEPLLVNPTSQAVPCQFWLNAALTLGSASLSANTEFVYPTERMRVHSTGDQAMPGERQIMTWPIFDGRDLSRYGNWRNWLGVFVPDVQANYTGAYNHETALGIVRVFPPEVARGLKLFAFGAGFPARAEYSDDGSEYFEMWGGPCKTFWPEDDLVLGPGQSLQWSEVWLPFSGTGGLDRASAEAVVKANVQGGEVHLGLAVGSPRRLQFHLKWNGQAFYQEWAYLAPDTPLVTRVPLPRGAALPGELTVQVRDSSQSTLLEYTKAIAS